MNQNPHLEVILNYAGPHYEPIHTLLVNAGQTREEALLLLNTTWT